MIDQNVTIGNTHCVPNSNDGALSMQRNSSESRPTEITVIVVLVALLVLLPPLLDLWGDVGNAWYMPYLVWSGIILLGYWLQRKLRKHAI